MICSGKISLKCYFWNVIFFHNKFCLKCLIIMHQSNSLLKFSVQCMRIYQASSFCFLYIVFCFFDTLSNYVFSNSRLSKKANITTRWKVIHHAQGTVTILNYLWSGKWGKVSSSLNMASALLSLRDMAIVNIMTSWRDRGSWRSTRNWKLSSILWPWIPLEVLGELDMNRCSRQGSSLKGHPSILMGESSVSHATLSGCLLK